MSVDFVVLLYFLAAILLAALFLYGLLFRRVPSALPFTLIMLFGAMWNVCSAMEIVSSQLPVKILWAELRFLPVTAIGLSWFVIALNRSGTPAWLTRARLLAFAIEPVIVVALSLTSQWHKLFRYAYAVNAEAPVAVLRYANGPFFYLHMAYTYGMLALTFIILIRSLRRSYAFHARNTALVIFGVSAMIVPELLYQVGITPVQGVNFTPVFLVVTGVSGAVAFFEFRILELLPIAGGTVVRTIQDPVLVFDMQDRLIEFNPRAGEILGLAQAVHVGQTLDALGLPWSGMIAHALEQPGARGEIPILQPDGERVFDLTTTPIKDKRGRPIGTLLLLHDMTERRRAEEALRRSEEALQHGQRMEAVGRLAGGIAHDFNNLLTVIGGYCDVISERLQGDDPLSRDIGEIRLAAERATSLTAQLLAFSRMQVLQPRILDMNALVEDMKGLLERLIGEDVRLEVTLDPEAGNIRADPGQIGQVVMNLAVNARDAMPSGGTLCLATSRRAHDGLYGDVHGAGAADFVLFTVSDTGIGMDKATVSRIFEPFFTTKEIGKGTGLGLSTVYGIVAQSGGWVECESEPGRGTRFSVYLPRVEGESDAMGKLPEDSLPPRGAETVLLVEDERAVRSFARVVLEKNGYEVMEAESGSSALALLGERDVDLLITDVVMPGMGGRELARLARQKKPGIRAMFVSGYDVEAISRRGPSAGDGRFIQKPFNSATLLRAVRETLDAPSPDAPRA